MRFHDITSQSARPSQSRIDGSAERIRLGLRTGVLNDQDEVELDAVVRKLDELLRSERSHGVSLDQYQPVGRFPTAGTAESRVARDLGGQRYQP